MTTSCMRCIVQGRVQGVFYRASAKDVATGLGLHGGVRNLPDGGVEVIACGEADSLKKLREWLQEGPPLARVDKVHCTEITEIPVDFRPDLSF